MKDTERMAAALQNAEAVFIGAGAGLSTAAGFTYDGERFLQHFSDFEAKYGFHDMYSGGFYPYPTMEEYWAYWSRYIAVNRYVAPPSDLYERLLCIVEHKDYFVLTTNVDHCFQRAGFNKQRLFYTQGDYGLFQCSEPCCQKTWDNESQVRKMIAEQHDLRIPSALLPVCPYCGKPATMNLRSDARFVQDDGWDAASKRYEDFVQHCNHKRAVYLEIGVGYNTPGIIKFNFWQQVYRNTNALYISLNRDFADTPPELAERSICIAGDSSAVIESLAKAMQRMSEKRLRSFSPLIKCS